jgi:hypothetical protein
VTVSKDFYGELLTAHDEFLTAHVSLEARGQLERDLPRLAGQIGFISVNGFLKLESERSLDELDLAGLVTRETLDTHPVAGPMFSLMRALAASNLQGVDAPGYNVRRLVANPAHPDYSTFYSDKQYWDGHHPVFYNRNVTGPHVVNVGNESIELQSNQLVVVNGHSVISIESRREACATLPYSIVPRYLAQRHTSNVPEEVDKIGRDQYLVL